MWYYYFNDPDNKCSGIADLITNLFFYILLLVTVIFAIIGTTKNRLTNNFKVEPITFSITILSVLSLVYNTAFRGHTTGDKWLYAESQNSNTIKGHQNITLRKNKNFTVNFVSTDFSCSLSGLYKQNGDTIIFDDNIADRSASKLSTKYLVKSTELIPLVDTVNKNIFTIITTK